jgi:hypothetical protein
MFTILFSCFFLNIDNLKQIDGMFISILCLALSGNFFHRFEKYVVLVLSILIKIYGLTEIQSTVLGNKKTQKLWF